jgi:hypothetical protein
LSTSTPSLLRPALAGSLVAVACSFLSSLTYQVYLNHLIRDILVAPLTWFVSLFIDHNLRRYLAWILYWAVTGSFPYLLVAALFSGAYLGCWLPSRIRPPHRFLPSLFLSAVTGIVAAAAVSAVPAARVAVFYLQERPPFGAAITNTFALNLGLVLPWALLATCSFTWLLHRRARRT